MRHLSYLLVLLLLVLTGCPRVPGLSLVGETPPLQGKVEWEEGYAIQATATEVANGATVSLIDPATGNTVVTTLTQPDGSFSLNLRNVSFSSDRPYLLEALKGLSAGGSANRAGAPAARIRTLVSVTSGSWTSLSGPSVRINPSTTALCIVSGFRALNLVQQQALMGTLPPATGAYAGTADLPAGDFTSVQALVNASLVLDQDPVHVIARNALDGTYVRMERGPFITNVSAMRATPGSIITLYGSGLDSLVANNVISFNGVPASSMSLVPGGIAVTVPAAATSGPLTVRVGNLETVVAPGFATALPMTSIERVAGTFLPAAGRLAGTWGVYPDGVAVRDGNVYFSSYHQVFKVSSAGVLSLVAGTGARGYAGDGGPAVSAMLNYPRELAVDAAGNVFICDGYNYVVRRVDAVTGLITTIAGNGSQGSTGDGNAATAARLNGFLSIALDAAGNVYLGDQTAGRVRKVTTATGLITTVAGGGTGTGNGIPATTAQLVGPRDITIDAAGNLYLAQPAANTVRKVDTAGNISTVLTGYAAWGVAVDGAGALYVYESPYYANYRITKYPTSGSPVTVMGAGGGALAAGPALNVGLAGNLGPFVSDADGTLYLCAGGNRLWKVAGGQLSSIAGNGTMASGNGLPALDAQFQSATGAVMDAAGNLYVNDLYQVRKITPDGLVSVFAGTGAYNATAGNGGPATSAGFVGINDIAVEPTGVLYILENNHRVRRVGLDGIISHYAGGGSSLVDGVAATSAQFNWPRSITLDKSGNLYVADYNNHRVCRIDRATATVTRVAGGGAVWGDGGPATSAQVHYPQDIAFDESNNMYIGNYSGKIRKVTAATGIITTIAGTGNDPIVGFVGNGGPAINATIGSVGSVAADRSGNVYFCSFNLVARVDTAGIVRIVAGSTVEGYVGDGGPAASARLSSPGRIDFDNDGRLMIGDGGNRLIRRLF